MIGLLIMTDLVFTIGVLVSLFWSKTEYTYFFVEVFRSDRLVIVHSSAVQIIPKYSQNQLRLVPAQDVLFALILWYVPKSIFRS